MLPFSALPTAGTLALTFTTAPPGDSAEETPLRTGSTVPVEPSQPVLLAPVEKRRFVTLNTGGRTSVVGGEPSGVYDYYGLSQVFGGFDFNLELAVGAHSKRRPSLAGAFVLDVSPREFPHLLVGGRFQWDKPILPEFALYSSLKTGLGFRFAPRGVRSYVDGEYYYESNDTLRFLRGQFDLSWGVEAILAERLLLSFRPANLSVSVPAFPVHFEYGVMGGAGVVW